MNKKLNYLSIIPLYGTCILLIYLFVLSIKDKISKKKFFKSFVICAIVSAICWYMVMMIVYIVSKKLIYFNFDSIGILITMIIGGYMMNAFTFIFINKKWEYLTTTNENEKTYFEKNKKPILIFALVASGVITIITIFLLVLFEII